MSLQTDVVALSAQLQGMALDTTQMLHRPMIQYYDREYLNALQEETHLSTRFEQIDIASNNNQVKGDEIVAHLNDVFYHGFGLQWSTTQQKIFNAFVDSCLPRIYGAGVWESVKSRVMRKRRMTNATPWVLVNMARRNGKTFVSAGTTAAMALTIPGLSIAIFSTGERASKMFRTAFDDMMTRAFEKATHVQEHQYKIITRNKEVLVFEHPSGAKQTVGCYPGSVRYVLNLYEYIWCLGWGCIHTQTNHGKCRIAICHLYYRVCLLGMDTSRVLRVA